MIEYTDPQGTEAWLAARRGAITASKFKLARDKTRKGEYTDAALTYACDLARERAGGTAPSVFQNATMKFGSEQEPFARSAYEARYGALVEEKGFIRTDDGKFGVSVDGLVGNYGVIEIKTLVSSKTLFSVVVDGDISDYRDQCLGAMWLLGRRWVDLCLWVPDLVGDELTVVRIERDEEEIAKLEDDLLGFERQVSALELRLRARMGGAA